MTLMRKILLGVLSLVVLALLAGALVLSHDDPCEPGPALADGTPRMKAVVYRCYGSPEVLVLEEIRKPVPADNRVLVRVHAASVNPLDYHYMRGTPYIMRMDSGLGRPSSERFGVDFAGTVEAVGDEVTRFRPGDEVFGAVRGALAEYVTISEAGLARKPDNLTFEQAAAMPIAALTALQALRDKGRTQPGDKVLINGASGGVGTFAVQIAKSFGAEVTGVCSTRNVELVRALGADHVVDYTQADFTQGENRYDLILDNVGNHSLIAYRRVLNPDGVYVMIGGPKDGKFLGPMGKALRAIAFSWFVKPEFTVLLSQLSADDMAFLADQAQSGTFTPVIDRRYPLAETAEAMRYLETGRARGKVIITVRRDDGG